MAIDDDVDPVVQVFEESGLNEFGFVLVRMDYGDDDEWRRWCEATDGPFDESIARTQGGKRIEDKMVTPLIENEGLEGKCFFEILNLYDELRNEGKVEKGADCCIALAVDKPAMDSLLSPTPGQKPWVWAVDSGVEFEPDQPMPSSDYEAPTSGEIYPGFFRVALSAVMTDLWPLLRAPALIPGVGISITPNAMRYWRPDKRIWDTMNVG